MAGHAPDERRVVCANARDGAHAQAVTVRQRTSEVATSGSAPPAERRRGSAANASGRSGYHHARVPERRASRAASDETSRPKLSRRKTVALECGNGSANCTLRERESAANEDATSCRKCGVEARSGRKDRYEGCLRGSPASKRKVLRGRLGQPKPPSSFLCSEMEPRPRGSGPPGAHGQGFRDARAVLPFALATGCPLELRR